MERIVKKDGYVYLVKENSNDGRFKTWYNLGKDPDCMEEEENPKPKKRTKQKKDKA